MGRFQEPEQRLRRLETVVNGAKTPSMETTDDLPIQSASCAKMLVRDWRPTACNDKATLPNYRSFGWVP